MSNTSNRIDFVKMHGLGNDYIYIDCFKHEIDSPSALAITLSDRHFSVGGDGIVLIMPPSEGVAADARMRMFNIDGSEGEMCGNAIRCVAKYLYDFGIVVKDSMKIETLSGIKDLTITIEDGLVSQVTVDMGKARLSLDAIPVLIPSASGIDSKATAQRSSKVSKATSQKSNNESNTLAQTASEMDMVVDYPIRVCGEEYRITCVSVGNPHCVVFCDNVDEIELERIGKYFEYHPLFPKRINTEFVEIIDQNTLKMRVFERGSGETLACGTGACASVVAASLNDHCKKGDEIKVILRGGELIIRYTDEGILMSGTAKKAFEGFVEL